MMKPRFSVIIPTLNEEKFLPKLLASLTRQTVKNFEVIIVDGNSTDRTVAVAKRFAKKLPITQLISEKTGVSRQRNMGAMAAKTDWLVFVDADSILLANFMERIGRFIDRKRAKFFTTWLKADSDDPADAIAGFLMNMSIEGAILIERPWAPGPLTVIRRDVFKTIGGYDENASYGEDHELSVIGLEKGIPFEILREILYIYSFRRFRKEGSIKVMERNMKSALKVITTKRGPKYIPGFVGGGSIYKDGVKRKSNSVVMRKFEQSARKLIEDFLAA